MCMKTYIDSEKLYQILCDLQQDVGTALSCTESSVFIGDIGGKPIMVTVMSKREAESEHGYSSVDPAYKCVTKEDCVVRNSDLTHPTCNEGINYGVWYSARLLDKNLELLDTDLVLLSLSRDSFRTSHLINNPTLAYVIEVITRSKLEGDYIDAFMLVSNQQDKGIKHED